MWSFYTSQICSESFFLFKIGKIRVKLLGYLEGYRLSIVLLIFISLI